MVLNILIKKNWISIVLKVGIKKSLKKQIQDHLTLIQKIKNHEHESPEDESTEDESPEDESPEDESLIEESQKESLIEENQEKRNNDEICKVTKLRSDEIVFLKNVF